jgi:hypothetical protein
MPPSGVAPTFRRDDEDLKAMTARLEQALNNSRQLENQLTDMKNKTGVCLPTIFAILR